MQGKTKSEEVLREEVEQSKVSFQNLNAKYEAHKLDSRALCDDATELDLLRKKERIIAMRAITQKIMPLIQFQILDNIIHSYISNVVYLIILLKIIIPHNSARKALNP